MLTLLPLYALILRLTGVFPIAFSLSVKGLWGVSKGYGANELKVVTG
jgi:hypothetical protein